MKNTLSLILLSLVLAASCTLTALAHWGSKGPFGGTVKSLVVADTFVYVCTPEGGLYRSQNRQVLAWKTFNNVMPSGKIQGYAQTGSLMVAATLDQGILVSADGGATWTAKNSGLASTAVSLVYASGSTLYAALNAGGGLYKSSNGGNSWTAISNGLTNTNVVCLMTINTTLIAGTTNGGIFYSLNEGANWSSANTGIGNFTVTSFAASGTTVYVSTGGGGLYSANASTLIWTSINTGLTDLYIHQVITTGSELIAATPSGVFATDVSVISWSAQRTGLPSEGVNALAVFEDKLVAGLQTSGLYTSPKNSISWTERNSSFNNLKTYALYANGNLIIAATEKGVYVSKNLAGSYTLCNQGLTDSLHVTGFLFRGSILYAGTRFEGMFSSVDTGKTWHSESNGATSSNVRLMIATNDRLIYVSGDNYMEMAPFSTMEWESYSGGLNSNSSIESLATDGYAVYAGTNDNGVYRRNANEEYWSQFNNPILNNQHITALTILGNKLFAGTNGNGIFISDQSTANWTLVNNGLPDLNILTLATTGPYVLAGYKGGVYATSNNGAQWQAPNTLLNIPSYSTITGIQFSTDRVFISTSNNSVYSNAKSELPGWTTTGMFETASTNQDFWVYPNPTSGRFRLAVKNDQPLQEIVIYNSNGIPMETFSSSEEDLQLNYPQGMYLVRVKTMNGKILQQKLLIE